MFVMRPATSADEGPIAVMIRARSSWMRIRGIRGWDGWESSANVLAGQAADSAFPAWVLTGVSTTSHRGGFVPRLPPARTHLELRTAGTLRLLFGVYLRTFPDCPRLAGSQLGADDLGKELPLPRSPVHRGCDDPCFPLQQTAYSTHVSEERREGT